MIALWKVGLCVALKRYDEASETLLSRVITLTTMPVEAALRELEREKDVRSQEARRRATRVRKAYLEVKESLGTQMTGVSGGGSGGGNVYLREEMTLHALSKRFNMTYDEVVDAIQAVDRYVGNVALDKYRMAKTDKTDDSYFGPNEDTQFASELDVPSDIDDAYADGDGYGYGDGDGDEGPLERSAVGTGNFGSEGDLRTSHSTLTHQWTNYSSFGPGKHSTRGGDGIGDANTFTLMSINTPGQTTINMAAASRSRPHPYSDSATITPRDSNNTSFNTVGSSRLSSLYPSLDNSVASSPGSKLPTPRHLIGTGTVLTGSLDAHSLPSRPTSRHLYRRGDHKRINVDAVLEEGDDETETSGPLPSPPSTGRPIKVSPKKTGLHSRFPPTLPAADGRDPSLSAFVRRNSLTAAMPLGDVTPRGEKGSRSSDSTTLSSSPATSRPTDRLNSSSGLHSPRGYTRRGPLHHVRPSPNIRAKGELRVFDSFLLNYLANVYLAGGRVADAFTAYKLSMGLDPLNIFPIINRATLARAHGMYSITLADYQSLLGIFTRRLALPHNFSPSPPDGAATSTSSHHAPNMGSSTGAPASGLRASMDIIISDNSNSNNNNSNNNGSTGSSSSFVSQPLSKSTLDTMSPETIADINTRSLRRLASNPTHEPNPPPSSIAVSPPLFHLLSCLELYVCLLQMHPQKGWQRLPHVQGLLAEAMSDYQRDRNTDPNGLGLVTAILGDDSQDLGSALTAPSLTTYQLAQSRHTAAIQAQFTELDVEAQDLLHRVKRGLLL